MNVEELREIASARRYTYAAFQRLVGDAPSNDLLEALDADVLGMAFEVIGCPPEARDRIDSLLEQLANASDDLDRMSDEYARIFVGPAALPAPAWESVYRDKKRVLMTATTLSVREFYRACGYEALEHRRVPDDHLAIELDFLASLAQDVLDACEAGDLERAQDTFDAATSFLKAHLSLWVGDFAAALKERDGSPFYCAVADALCVFVNADCDWQ